MRRSNEITVRTLPLLFRPERQESWAAVAGRPLLSYAPEAFRTAEDVHVVVNGEAVPREEIVSRRAMPGDDIVITRLPRGMDPASLISLIVSIVMIGVSFAVAVLSAPSSRQPIQEMEESPTYGWDGIHTTVAPGTPIPVIYGTHRVGGHVIAQFERERRNATGEQETSSSELSTLLALAAGPIDGVSGLRINRQPVENLGADIRTEWRPGVPAQDPLAGFSESIVSSVVSQEILYTDQEPWVFRTTGLIDAFELQVRFPGGLFRTTDSGGITSGEVRIQVDYRLVGGPSDWILATGPEGNGQWRITGRTRNPKDYWLRQDGLDRGFYDIRVRRLTPDDADTDIRGTSASTVRLVNEILDERLSYPGLALLAVRQIPSSRLSGSIPQYDCLVRGSIVRVYSSTETYVEEWSDNPAWCLLDFLTSKDRGQGAWCDLARIDLDSFIAWASWCDELVPVDERGALEKRARINIVLDGSLTVIDAIKQFTVAGQAMFFVRGDRWAIKIDRAEPAPRQLFQMSRIHKGSFRVTKFARSELANVIVGEYFDETLDYERDVLSVEDPVLTESEDHRERKISLVGTTSRSQAQRLLNYFMLANRLTRREIRFEVGAEAIACEAGDVVAIAHDVPGWGSSGRIRNVENNGSTLVLDRTVTLEEGASYEVTILHAEEETVDVLAVTSLPGSSPRINVGGTWSYPPRAGLDYSIGPVGRSTVLYRVVSITSGSSPAQRSVVARQYDPDVYGADLLALPDPSPTTLPDPDRIPPAVRDLRLAERICYAEDGTLRAAIDCHYTLPAVAGARAAIYWRILGDASWTLVGLSENGYFSITENVESPGADGVGVPYEISVVSVAPSGARGSPDTGVRETLVTVGSTRRPGIVRRFSGARTLEGVIFSWDPLDPADSWDLDYYEIRSGPTWDAAVTIGRTKDTTLATTAVVRGLQTFLCKAVNTAGRDSPEPAVYVMLVEGRIGENVIYTRVEDPAWSGTRDHLDVIEDRLVLDTADVSVGWRASIRGRPGRSAIGAGGYGIGYRVSGSYTSAPFEIADSALRCLVATEIEADQVDRSLYWDALSDVSWDSDFARSRQWSLSPDARVQVRVEMRFSSTDSLEASFGPWQARPQNAEVLVRWAQVRVLVEVRDPAYTVSLSRLRIAFDVPDVVDSGVVDTTAVGMTALAYNKSFNAPPRVTATVEDAIEGDAILVDQITASGFRVGTKNGGSWVERAVHWHALGY